jgi:hypothetical protein
MKESFSPLKERFVRNAENSFRRILAMVDFVQELVQIVEFIAIRLRIK